jgi:hypothetical protein
MVEMTLVGLALCRAGLRRIKNMVSLVATALALLVASGCMTRGVIGKPRMTSEGEPSKHTERPGLYFFTPLTAVGDAVTLPVQACLHFSYKGSEADPWR